MRATTALWRKLAKQHGLDGLVLVKVESFATERNRHPDIDGFVTALDFQPHWAFLPHHCNHPSAGNCSISLACPSPLRSALIGCFLPRRLSPPCWPDLHPPVPYPLFPCDIPAWDNITRRRQGGATILNGFTPSPYGN